jgi:hypothetical protein
MPKSGRLSPWFTLVFAPFDARPTAFRSHAEGYPKCRSPKRGWLKQKNKNKTNPPVFLFVPVYHYIKQKKRCSSSCVCLLVVLLMRFSSNP